MTDNEELDTYNQIPTLFGSDDEYQQDTVDLKQTSYASELDKPQEEPKETGSEKASEKAPKEEPEKSPAKKKSPSKKKTATKKKTPAKKKSPSKKKETVPAPGPEPKEEPPAEDIPIEPATIQEDEAPIAQIEEPPSEDIDDEPIVTEDPEPESVEIPEEEATEEGSEEGIERIGPAPVVTEDELPICALCGMPVMKGQEGIPIDGAPTHKDCVEKLMESEADEPQILDLTQQEEATKEEGSEEEIDDLTTMFDDDDEEEADDDEQESSDELEPEEHVDEEGDGEAVQQEVPEGEDGSSETEDDQPAPQKANPICASCGKEIDTDEDGCLILIKNTPFCRHCVENNLDMKIAVVQPSLGQDKDQNDDDGDEEPLEEEEQPKDTKGKVKAFFKGRDNSKAGEREKRRKKKPSKDDNVDPDSFKERLRRWYLVTFKNYVRLRTLSRNNRTGEFIQETTLVKKKDLPHDAVQCTGERGFYCLDLIKDSDWYVRNHYKNMGLKEYQFTASDACLYMQSNKIDNALAVNWTERANVDMLKIVMIVGVVLVIGLIVVMRM